MPVQKEVSLRVKEALANQTLRTVLGRFADAFVLSRAEAFSGYDFSALRDHVVSVRDYTISHLPELADEFEKQARARGVTVFRAPDGPAAVRYVTELARRNGISLAVKSKSMASEEIGLNQGLAAAGVRAVETDLGEWIIQQAGQRPSHMVMPAIHLSKEQVAAIFARTLRQHTEADIGQMVRVARATLRREFLQAQMGITGANAAVASTGTLLILTNEGNARLTTTLPPVHVAIVGYEKLIPTFADLVPILRTLPRNATAQHLTSYATFISGPAPAAGGPKEVHVVLLDNGRLQLAQDPVFRVLLRCLRCAACLNVCPVFSLVGGHVFGGQAYTGGIGSLLTAFLPGGPASLLLIDQPQSLCTACGACLEYCACGLPIPELILELRHRLASSRNPAPSDRLVAALTGRPGLMNAALAVGRVLSRPLQRDRTTHTGPLLREATSFRTLPALQKPLAASSLAAVQGVAAPVKTVAFYAGCLVEHAYPEIGRAALEVLARAGFAPFYPRGQACCGAPAIYTGQDAGRAAHHNIGVLLDSGADAVVTCCPTCAVALKYDYPRILRHSSAGGEEARTLGERTFEFCQFLATQDLRAPLVSAARPADSSTPSPLSVTYHDSCHLRYRLGEAAAPRRLLGSLPHLTYREMPRADRCCGFAGTYSFKHPAVSATLLERKLNWIDEAGADILAVACPGCLLQIRGGLQRRRRSRPTVMHVAQILASGGQH